MSLRPLDYGGILLAVVCPVRAKLRAFHAARRGDRRPGGDRAISRAGARRHRCQCNARRLAAPRAPAKPARTHALQFTGNACDRHRVGALCLLHVGFWARCRGRSRRTPLRRRAPHVSRMLWAVLPRWGSIVTVVGAAVLALVAAYTAAFAILCVPLLIAFAVGALSIVAPFAIVVAVAALAFAFLLILVATACSLCAVVVERYPATWSLRLTVERLFNRREFWRAVFFAATAAAIGLAVSMLVDIRRLCRLFALAGPLRRSRRPRKDRRRAFSGRAFCRLLFRRAHSARRL